MASPKRKDKSYYLDQLREVGLVLLSEYTYAGRQSANNTYQCLKCDHIWAVNQSISSKISLCKRYNSNGCPECDKVRREFVSTPLRTNNLQKLKELGYIVLTEDYDGRDGTNFKIKVQKVDCGHINEVTPRNLLSGRSVCKECNNIVKANNMREFNDKRYKEFLETATPWRIYKKALSRLTTATYKQYKHIINPLDLKVGRAKIGAVDTYHVDHIVAGRVGFDNGIPLELMSHYTNLQMLHWRDNISKRVKITEIPLILAEYIPL